LIGAAEVEAAITQLIIESIIWPLMNQSSSTTLMEREEKHGFMLD
jgi:hypothetical protein